MEKWKPIGKFEEIEDDMSFMEDEEELDEEAEEYDEAERVGFHKTQWGWM